MKHISVDEALSVIKKTNGRIFSASFLKKNGELRIINCRLGVKSHLKGGELKYDPIEHGLVTVFDVQSREYRSINLNTLFDLKANKESYIVYRPTEIKFKE